MPGRPSAYLLVSTLPWHSSTDSGTKFSLAIISSVRCWRSSSWRRTSAISGSTSASGRLKKSAGRSVMTGVPPRAAVEEMPRRAAVCRSPLHGGELLPWRQSRRLLPRVPARGASRACRPNVCLLSLQRHQTDVRRSVPARGTLSAVFFDAEHFCLTLAQAACVALPAAGLPRWAERYRRSWWALVVPGSIVAVIGGIELAPGTADVLTWVALILVPIGGALALGWAAHGAGSWLALLAVRLVAVAWAWRDTRAGQRPGIVRIPGSAVTAGRLLAGVAPL